MCFSHCWALKSLNKKSLTTLLLLVLLCFSTLLKFLKTFPWKFLGWTRITVSGKFSDAYIFALVFTKIHQILHLIITIYILCNDNLDIRHLKRIHFFVLTWVSQFLFWTFINFQRTTYLEFKNPWLDPVWLLNCTAASLESWN